MATISAELSTEFSLFPYDSVLDEYLKARAKRPFEPVHPDPDATYERDDRHRPLRDRAASRQTRFCRLEFRNRQPTLWDSTSTRRSSDPAPMAG